MIQCDSKNGEGLISVPDLFTSERSNIDYVTLGGVCKRTGANEDELPEFLLKELVDNGLDFIEVNMPPPYDEPVEIYVDEKNLICNAKQNIGVAVNGQYTKWSDLLLVVFSLPQSLDFFPVDT